MRFALKRFGLARRPRSAFPGSVSNKGTAMSRTLDFVSSIDSRLIAGKSQNVFAEQDHVKRRYKRDPNCWAADVDLSAFSVWNSLDGPRRAGTLITSDCVLLAAHFPLGPGTRIRFVRDTMPGDLNGDGVTDFADLTIFSRTAKRSDADYFTRLVQIARNFDQSAIIERTIVATARATSPVMSAREDDLLLAKLDSPITGEIIRPVALLSPGVQNSAQLNAHLNAPTIPIASLNQHRQILVAEVRRQSIARDAWIDAVRPIDARRSRMYGGLNPGDSGCAVFMLAGRLPVLLYCARRGSPLTVSLSDAPPGGGPFAGFFADAIAQTIRSLTGDVASLRVARTADPSTFTQPFSSGL